MNLTQWRRREPSNLASLRDEMDRLFGRFWTGLPFDGGEMTAWAPPLNVSETEEEIRVEAELPGIQSDDVEVNVHGDLLTISGERKAETEEKNRSYHRVERRYGQFVRTLQLPTGVDAEKVSATYEKGVLNITLPKSAESKPRKIAIKEEK